MTEKMTNEELAGALERHYHHLIESTRLSWEDKQDIKAAADALRAMSWRLIEEAPKDGTRFLAYERGAEPARYECWWQTDFGHWEGWKNDWDSEPEPNFWLSLNALPQPPEPTDD